MGKSYGRDAARVRVGARRDVHGHCRWPVALAKVWRSGKELTLTDQIRNIQAGFFGAWHNKVKQRGWKHNGDESGWGLVTGNGTNECGKQRLTCGDVALILGERWMNTTGDAYHGSRPLNE